MSEPGRLRNYIGGKWVLSESETWLPSYNPSDPSDVVALFPSGTQGDVEQAVCHAETALAHWSTLAGPARADFLYLWANMIADKSEKLAQEMAREVGKPISEARGEVARCGMILRYFAGEAVREIGQVIPAQVHGSLQFSVRQPLGVVGLITPWNFPLAIPLWKAAPALAFGNTVVLKSAEASSHMSYLLAETAEAAGIPAGVFNVVLGTGPNVGAPLLDSPKVHAMSFTGSQKVGMALATRAASRNVKFQGEMGGKNVAIVMADSDLDQAAALIAGGAMRYAGQKCTATSRVVVQKSVRDTLIQKLETLVADFVMGPVTDPKAAIGPVISAESQRKLLDAVRDCGGDARVDDPGYFVKPSILKHVSWDHPNVREELFGPVLAILTAEDIDEAIDLANRTEFGLSATIFTRDINSALKYAHRIQAGMVRVNGDTTGVDPHAPFGGLGSSSTHSREQGPSAREFYTELKTIQINPSAS